MILKHMPPNTKHLLVALIIVAFVLYYVYRGYTCPCPLPKDSQTSRELVLPCARYEIEGWQVNHLVFYTILGMLFPNDFWLWQGLGVLWEMVEFVPYIHPSVLGVVGGCVRSGSITAPAHWLDRSVGLPSPPHHFWHVKLTDVILNIIGFVLGVVLRRITMG